MRPEVGSSRPAIMRKVVVLPQPDGPSRQKKAPSGMVKLDSLTATNSPKAFFRFSTRISAIGLLHVLYHPHPEARAQYPSARHGRPRGGHPVHPRKNRMTASLDGRVKAGHDG